MNLGEQLNRQRVKHIASSYRLEGENLEAFSLYLEELLQNYPTPLIELALVETLVDQWVIVPMPKGCDFLQKAHALLQFWQSNAIASTITPEQFHQISGLDPCPIFGPPERSLPNLPIH
jgi:hypothetical protein